MFPDKSQPQPPGAASLPPVPTPEQASQPPLAAPAAVPMAAPLAGATANSDPAQVIAQAKQLVLQYQQDPFRLSGALQQLKNGYLADHHHVIINPVEN